MTCQHPTLQRADDGRCGDCDAMVGPTAAQIIDARWSQYLAPTIERLNAEWDAEDLAEARAEARKRVASELSWQASDQTQRDIASDPRNW